MIPHYAVVVGIRRYVGFQELVHAVKDAEAFAGWLTTRGGLHPTRVTLVTSPDGDGPLPKPDAKPLAHQVFDAVEAWRDEVRAAVNAGTLEWEDTRLYVYVSGHGLAPTPEDAALLPADATLTRTGNVSLAELRAFLKVSQEFREVVLLADCCRDLVEGAPKQGPPWTQVNHPGRPPVRVLFWRATAFAQKAFEAPADADPAAQHGYFTRALLAALREDPPSGVLDSVGVADRLVAELPKLLPPGREQVPDVLVDPAAPIVFWRAPAAAAPPPAPAGEAEVEATAASGVPIAVYAGAVPVGMGRTRLVTSLAAGTYTFRFGTPPDVRVVEQVVSGPVRVADPGPGFAAVAPILDHAGANETHVAAVSQLVGHHAPGLVVVVRWRRDDPGPVDPSFDGLALGGVPLVPSRSVARHEDGRVRLLGARVDLPPGTAFLEFPSARGRPRCLPVTLHPGWVTTVFAPPDTLTGRASLEGAEVHRMRPSGGTGEATTLSVALALDALARGVAAVPRREVRELLQGKWEDPFLGVLGAHVLLLADDVDWNLVTEVLANLVGLLPGDPDVVGLLGQAGRRAPAGVSLPAPPPQVDGLPSLWRSWEGLLWLDQQVGVVPDGSPAAALAVEAVPAGPWVSVPPPGATGPEAVPYDAVDEDASPLGRVLAWATSARTREATTVALGTRLPLGFVRRVLG